MGSEKKRNLIFLVSLWTVILVWRGYLLARYLTYYVDDDQALMWYGTALFAHGIFPQPAFFGQSYGTMFESLLIVPLYLCGWPLHIAQPVITAFMGIVAFLFGSVYCFKKEKYNSAFFCVLFLALTGWQWDVVTSMRCYFTGLPIAVIGCILLNDPEAGNAKVFCGSLLTVIGAVWSASALSLLGIGYTYFIWNYRKSINLWISFACGNIVGIILFVSRKVFFERHPDYIIFKMTSHISLKAFIQNMGLLPRRLAENFFGGWIGAILIPAVILFFIYQYYNKEMWKHLTITILSVFGSLFMLSSTQMNAYNENTINYCQLRMLLYMTFLGLLLMILLSCNENNKESHVGWKKIIIISGIMIVSVFVKGSFFERALEDPDSVLYGRGAVNYMDVRTLYDTGEKIIKAASKNEADILISSDFNLSQTYGFSALYYDTPYVFYLPTYDRRVWVYNDLLRQKKKKIMFYDFLKNGELKINIEDTGEKSVIEHLEKNHNIYRHIVEVNT